MKKTVVAMISATILVLVLGGLAVVVGVSKQTGNKTDRINQAGDTSSVSSPTTDPNKTPSVTITYTDDGFSPAHLRAKSGDVIKVVNNSSGALEFSSDPHPIHTKDQDLNQQVLQPGASQTFVVTKKGTFGFHDHLNSSKTGSITVE